MKYNIVMLDSSMLNPGDLSFAEIEKLGNLTVYKNSTPDQVIPRSIDADILVTNKIEISKEVIDSLPKLKCVCLSSTGYNVVDTAYAREKNIDICNVPTYCRKAVAQSTFALLFALTNTVAEHNASVKNGDWCKSDAFCYQVAPLIELEGLTMGVIGYGNIGKDVAKIANCLGMNVLVNTRSEKPMDDFCQKADLETLFKNSDVISLNCPLTPQTTKMINEQSLALMKKNAIIINTSRGAVIDEEAVANALNNDKIYGFVADVLSTEPPKEDNPLLTAKNCVITPHIAWDAKGSRERLLGEVVLNIKNFILGSSTNVVN